MIRFNKSSEKVISIVLLGFLPVSVIFIGLFIITPQHNYEESILSKKALAVVSENSANQSECKLFIQAIQNQLRQDYCFRCQISVKRNQLAIVTFDEPPAHIAQIVVRDVKVSERLLKCGMTEISAANHEYDIEWFTFSIINSLGN